MLEPLLDPIETKRAERLVFPKRRDEFITQRGILRSILSRYLAQKPEEIQISTSERGKPYLPTGNIQFNLSHSNNLMICGITSGPRIGVDIQHVYPIDNLERVIPKILSPQEIDFLEKTPQRDKLEHFFMIWTAKEAFLKALGSGFQSPVNTIQLVRDLRSGSILQVEDPSEDCDWFIYELEIEPSYKSFLAVEGREIQVKKMVFAPEATEKENLH